MISSTLRPDQIACVNKAISLDGRMLILNDRRTGKTRTALAIAEALKCERVLLVGFNSFIHSWDYELVELEETGNPFHLPFIHLNDPSVLKRAIKLRQLAKRKEPAFVAVNYESWWRKDLRAAIRSWQPDLIIYDEGHRLISRTAHSARFAHQIARSEPWYKHGLVLTATWQEHGFGDIFSLMKAIDVDVFSADFEIFKQNYVITATHTCKNCGEMVSELKQLPRGTKVCEPPWHCGYFLPCFGSPVLGYKNTDVLFDIIKEHSTRTLQSEVGILQPKNMIVPIELSASTRKQYDTFMRKHVYQFNNSDQSLEVFARIALSAIVKGQEVTGGWVQDQNGGVIDISREKLDAVTERAREENRNGHQHAITAKFVHDIERIAGELKIPLEMTYSRFAGDGKKGQEQRKEILRQLIRGNLETIIGSGSMFAYGLNLSRCRAMSLYSVDYSSIEWEQLNGRLQAPNKEPVHYIYSARDTIDERVIDALMRKTELRLTVFGERPVPMVDLDKGDEPGVILPVYDEEDEWTGF